MKKKIIFFAFATKDLSNSVKRLKTQALVSNFYDQIKILNNSDIDKRGNKILSNFSKKRGYGYWFWKPYLILKIFKTMKEGDILHYADVGCHINKNGYKKFNEYIKIINKDNKGILAFQYYPLKNKNRMEFPKRQEYKYTKADLLNFFGFLRNKKIIESGQFWAGNFFMKKNSFTISFLKDWLNIFENNYELVDDSPSKITNRKDFIENRHDQSIFSLLCKKNKILALSAYECEWCLKQGKRYWGYLTKSPIIAKRDLSYNLLRRFINRQKRTYSRYKKKFLIKFFNRRDG